MKKPIIIAMMIGLPVMVFGQAGKQQPGKIKKVIVTEHVFEKGAEKVYKDSETRYDASGNTIEENEYKAGKIDKHMVYEYDAANNKIKETELDVVSGKPVKTTEYKYNSNNLKTEKAVYDAGHKLKSKKVYQYESF
jgi:hypothetical protein